MTDSNATERLCALLDERGVFWEKGVGGITTCVGDWCFVEYPNGKLAATCEPTLTPEQAIEATLGRGTVPSVEWNRIITGLIAAHYDKDEERFKETAVKAAKMYDEAGKYEVSEYIVAQYNPAMAFVPM